MVGLLDLRTALPANLARLQALLDEHRHMTLLAILPVGAPPPSPALQALLAELGRYYPGWIINTSERLQNVAVTGNYRLDQPLEAVRSLAHITSARLQEYPALVILN